MPSKWTAIASLQPELTAFIAAKVGTHQYQSASERVRAALRIPDVQDQQGEHQQQNSAEKEHDAR